MPDSTPLSSGAVSGGRAGGAGLQGPARQALPHAHDAVGGTPDPSRAGRRAPLTDALRLLAGVPHVQPVEQLAHLQDLLGCDGDVGGLALRAARRLVQHDAAAGGGGEGVGGGMGFGSAGDGRKQGQMVGEGAEGNQTRCRVPRASRAGRRAVPALPLARQQADRRAATSSAAPVGQAAAVAGLAGGQQQ